MKKLRDADAMLNSGKDLALVLQALEVSEATLKRWRKQYGGMKSEEVGRGEPAAQAVSGREGTRHSSLEDCSEGKLVSPFRRRAVVELRQQLNLSERRACRAIGQPRSSQRYRSQPRTDEGPLVKRMLELVQTRPRFGYRRIAALLRAEGFRESESRILRLWRREGLKVPQKKRKRRRLSTSENGCHCRQARHANDVWAWDFVFDKTTGGSQLKWLNIVDEFTRECLVCKPARGITSEDVIDTLAELFVMRGVPRHIRSDNGPEFIANAIQSWLKQLEIEALYIEPSSPWENGYAESFNSRFRDEFLRWRSLKM